MGFKRMAKNLLGTVRCWLAGVKAGRDVYVGSRVHIVNGRHVTLADGVQVRSSCDLFAGGGILLGSRTDVGERCRFNGDVVVGEAVLFGPDSYISSVDHRFVNTELSVLDQGCYSPNKNGHAALRIGDGSWIGCHCAIIGDVHIGKHCVVGANSVVTRDVPDFCVVAGTPARIIKHFDNNTGVWERVLCD